jgi:cathepsin X
VLNQHLPQYCGSCWAFASLSALSDRLKISRQARGADVILSMQHVLNCGNAGTCNGGNQLDVYAWIHRMSQETGTGVAYDTVNPYIACSAGNKHADGTTSEGFCASKAVLEGTTCEPINVARSCSTFDTPCTPLSSYPNATINEYGIVGRDNPTIGEANAVQSIMEEVFRRGPVACSVDAEPIDKYRGGVLTHGREPARTNHVVSIVGWGTTGSGLDYWVARNSWGESWGELGFFRVERGRNLLNIEEDCAWATLGSHTGQGTELNVPCAEDGSNCLPKGMQAPAGIAPYAYDGSERGGSEMALSHAGNDYATPTQRNDYATATQQHQPGDHANPLAGALASGFSEGVSEQRAANSLAPERL